ncbi:post-PEP-CTERM-1 domain-containing protein [Xanthomonas dyei]|uniref:post-PEP-CTERM-1 domain-containing protein n=1 Tax=Xanthomonas dyei TaxID=743699 RepID=UPI0032E8C5E7
MMSFRKPGWMLSGVLCVACLPAAAGAQDAAASSKVGIDPVTGKLRPLTDAESAALDQQAGSAARSAATRTTVPQTEAAARATERRLPNGTVARKLPATQMSSLTATRQADGRIVIEHSDDADTQPAHAEHGALPHE